MTMQLLPFMNFVTILVLPLFVEGICIVFAVTVYLLFNNHFSKIIFIQIFVIIICSIALSYIIKINTFSKNQQAGLECTIIQGGYSAKDYSLIEKHPTLTELLVQRYLAHLNNVENARFVILPESTFPVYQKIDGTILQSIKEISLLRNEYILTSLLLEEDGKTYNTVFLVNPQGEIQNIYVKKNLVPFIETSKFEKDETSSVFNVDN
jgi:apolipoprotein N-acyltransferase